jgi:hypothetical protein
MKWKILERKAFDHELACQCTNYFATVAHHRFIKVSILNNRG